MKKWWELLVNAAAGGTKRATLKLFGQISDVKWWDEDVTPHALAKELDDAGDLDEIEVLINSPGGSFFAGLAIYNILKQHAAPVTTVNYGMAASAASAIFMAGDVRKMHTGTMLFVHNVQSYVVGDSQVMEKRTADLKKMNDAAADIYSATASVSKDEIIAMMNKATWMSPAEALEMGFATEIDAVPVVASLQDGKFTVGDTTFDLSEAGLTIPEALMQTLVMNAPPAKEPPAQELENNEPPPADPPAQNQQPPDPLALERARMREIDALAARVPGCEALTHKAKYDTPLTPEAFSHELITGGYTQRALEAAKRTADAANLNDLHGDAKSLANDQVKAKQDKILSHLQPVTK